MAVLKALGSHRLTFVRDTIVATAVIAGLYGLSLGTRFRFLQIPGYLLIVWFDVLEVTFGSAGANYYVLFAAYLLGLGVVGAIVAHVIRERSSVPNRFRWRIGVAGGLVVVGLLSLLFALNVRLLTTQSTPVFITGATGLIMLVVAGLIVGLSRSSDEQT